MFCFIDVLPANLLIGIWLHTHFSQPYSSADFNLLSHNLGCVHWLRIWWFILHACSLLPQETASTKWYSLLLKVIYFHFRFTDSVIFIYSCTDWNYFFIGANFLCSPKLAGELFSCYWCWVIEYSRNFSLLPFSLQMCSPQQKSLYFSLSLSNFVKNSDTCHTVQPFPAKSLFS